MRQECIKIYKYDELSEEAKEKAIEKLYDINVDHDWYDFSFDDFSTIAKMIGIDLEKRPVKLMGGGTRYEPSIFFSGFSSQGDGACFEGDYRYNPGALKAIKDYAPQDTELHNIVKGLQDIQRKHFYRLSATVKHTGHYCHAYSTTISVYNDNNEYGDTTKEAEDSITESLRDLMNWIYRGLEKEYEYLTSREAIEETIQANEYEFTENGELY